MIKISDLPKVLIISHTSFTSSDSMGSTLASYFTEYDSEKLAQFYIKNMKPDISVCKRYYRLTDEEALKSMIAPFSRKKVGREIALDAVPVKTSAAVKDKKSGNAKNRSLRTVLRNIIWNLSRFRKKGFNKWVREFSPDVILVQPGDFAFLLNLSVKLSKELNIPLIVHQSEAYYLKPYYYKRLSYLIYRKHFDKSFKRMMNRASLCIYLCDALQKDYSRCFDTPGVTIYKSTKVLPEKREKEVSENEFRCIYGGNLGKAVGRAEPLVELGKAVKQCGGIIDVFTSSKGEHLACLNEENGIVLHSAIPNDELVERTKASDFVVHIENQSNEHISDLKYAFSTKIADMLACGRPCIIYGSAEIAGIKYFADNKLGLVIQNNEDLYPKIKELVNNKDLQESFVNNALDFAKSNHDPKQNSLKTRELIIKVAENKV